jgi:hypothetical protein
VPIPERVFLLDDSETIHALKLSAEDLEHLVRTEQLPAIYISGKRRFLLGDVEALVSTYQIVQHRR